MERRLKATSKSRKNMKMTRYKHDLRSRQWIFYSMIFPQYCCFTSYEWGAGKTWRSHAINMILDHDNGFFTAWFSHNTAALRVGAGKTWKSHAINMILDHDHEFFTAWGAKSDEGALKGDREVLNGNGDSLKNDEKTVKGDGGALRCDRKAFNFNIINVEGRHRGVRWWWEGVEQR